MNAVTPHEIHLPNNWTPRVYQEPLWRHMHAGGKRANVAWHRRAGKDDLGLHYTACAAHERPGTYWHMLPEAKQARKAIWDAVNPHTGKRRIDEAFPLEIRETTRNDEMFIRFKCGSTWQVVGSDNFNSLVGTPPVGIIFSEWSISNPYAWSYLRPILAENDGWAIFIFTPRGRNHATEMFDGAVGDPNWFTQKLTVDDTDVFSKEKLDQELKELQREMGEKEGLAFFNQEYRVDFDAPIIGAIYAGAIANIEKADRITDVLHVPNRKVHTAWDLGRSDLTCIWFFQVGPGAVYFIDYYENCQEDVDHYVNIIHGKNYVYGTHYVPWDARIKHLAAKRSVLEQLHDLGVRAEIVKDHNESDRIAAGRTLMRRSYFDRERCKDGIKALRAYHYKWDANKRKLSTEAVHDWASHGADAFGYGGVAYKEISPESFTEPEFKLPTLNDIWRDRESNGSQRRI